MLGFFHPEDMILFHSICPLNGPHISLSGKDFPPRNFLHLARLICNHILKSVNITSSSICKWAHSFEEGDSGWLVLHRPNTEGWGQTEVWLILIYQLKSTLSVSPFTWNHIITKHFRKRTPDTLQCFPHSCWIFHFVFSETHSTNLHRAFLKVEQPWHLIWGTDHKKPNG